MAVSHDEEHPTKTSHCRTSDNPTPNSSPTEPESGPEPPHPVTTSSHAIDGQLRLRHLTLEPPGDDMSGVNTPSRFAQSYDSPKPLSSRHFTDVIDRRLQEAAGDPPRRRTDATVDVAEPREARQRDEHGRHHIQQGATTAETTLGVEESNTPRPGNSRHVANTRGRNQDDSDHEGHRKTKAFAFYGQVSGVLVGCRPHADSACTSP